MNILAWLITLVSFLVVIYVISYKTGEGFLGILPGVTGGLLLILYLLAFVRGMDYIWVVSLLALLVGVYRNFHYKRQKASLGAAINSKVIKGQLYNIKRFYAEPQTILVIICLILIAVLTSKHVYTWWDDINFWATDSKALYFMNGFPGKYGNVAPEFGDYPPALQIAKWCFLKLGSSYNEGLAFSGYYVVSAIFILPLIRPLREKNIVFQIIGLIAALLVPGICNIVWSQGGCADVVMGYIFGTILIDAMDYDLCDKPWYYIRLGIYLSVLCLTKSSGFQWAIYAVIFIFCIAIGHNRVAQEQRISLQYLLISVVCASLFQASWWIFCLLNRRIAKLTSSGVHMVSNGYRLPEDATNKAKLFLEGLIHYPMHTDYSALFNISSLAMILIFVATIVIIGVIGIIRGHEFRTLLIFTTVVSIVVYFIIYLGHISIFNGETQYDTANVMAISISRYASPLTIGILMLCLYIIVNRVKKTWIYVLSLVFILATTDLGAYFKTVYLYRNSIEDELNERYAVVDDRGRDYIKAVENNKELWGHRVLFLRDANSAHWVKDTYINYYASPVPTVYESFNVSLDNAEYVKDMITKNHAEYIYVEPQEAEGEGIFSNFLTDDTFKYATIYKVMENANGIVLVQ